MLKPTLTPEAARALADELEKRGANYAEFVSEDVATNTSTWTTDDEHGGETFTILWSD